MKQMQTLLKNHFSLEYRNGAQGLGLIVLVWIVSYIIYRLTPDLTAKEFNMVYWVFLLLISVNITLRIENHNSENEHLFLYTLVDPLNVIGARIIFNFFYLTVIALSFYSFLFLFFAELSIFCWPYVFCIVVGAFTISTSLSFVTAIGRYAQGQNTIISILSIPLLIPVILILNVVGQSIILQQNVDNSKYLILLAISLLSISLSIILFPFVWKK